MKCFARTFPLLLSGLLLAGCSSEFDGDSAKAVLEASPVQLSGEQLLLSNEQVACGETAQLWQLTQVGPGRALGRLTGQGRALNFSDDVRVGDPGSAGPMVQVSGKFSLQALKVESFQAEGERVKVVEARTGVVVKHDCFRRALPTLMGVQRGEFTSSANPMFRLRLREENWTVEEVLH